ncbi:NADH pyrophosphatase [Lachnospiraceae bacterium KM106-2]|nr:NADH pyrophosphatase [Lachnospiraceae bacterium KM106-2]
MRYKFCPECGAKLIEKPAGDDGLVPFCKFCDRYWFDSFSSCVIILVANEYDELVLIRQGYLSKQYASFVAGYMTPGENAEETAMREVKEEIGIDVEKLEYAGTYWFDAKGLLMHGFLAYARKCDLVLSSEVDSASWVPAKEAPAYMFPDSPGNAASAIYKKYIKKKQAK